MTDGATDGEPTMYGTLPALPAEATTMMPRFEAFSAEIADGSFGSPKSEPRLMLITSR